MLYDGEPVELTAEQEEIANMFGVMKETDYMKKQIFLDNFWNDFRKVFLLFTPLLYMLRQVHCVCAE